jgi:hypothetical protein
LRQLIREELELRVQEGKWYVSAVAGLLIIVLGAVGLAIIGKFDSLYMVFIMIVGIFLYFKSAKETNEWIRKRKGGKKK